MPSSKWGLVVQSQQTKSTRAWGGAFQVLVPLGWGSFLLPMGRSPWERGPQTDWCLVTQTLNCHISLPSALRVPSLVCSCPVLVLGEWVCQMLLVNLEVSAPVTLDMLPGELKEREGPGDIWPLPWQREEHALSIAMARGKQTLCTF